ncbi:MAG TPA: hypothetical protein VHX15_22010 [Frankiaceae bacterium]|jgi:hypothetical protein|nr:hypothetical protein [Frankiaceae bacterium]
MQDEFGRPLSDDGQWVWDGSAWRPTAAQAGPGGPAGGGLDSTMVAPRDFQPTGGQPAQGDYYQSQSGAPYSSQYGPQGGYGPGGPGTAGGPGGPGGPKEPVPWYKRQGLMVTLIAILLVLSAVLVTVLLLTRGDSNDNAAPPSPSPTAAPPTTEVPTTPPPTTEAPTTPPPTTTPPTTPPPTSVAPPDNTVVPGIYDCTSGGSQIGTVNFQGTRYTTSSGATGSYLLDPTTDDISFTGGDLGAFTGTYDPNGPSMDLTSSSGSGLHCAQ